MTVPRQQAHELQSACESHVRRPPRSLMHYSCGVNVAVRWQLLVVQATAPVSVHEQVLHPSGAVHFWMPP